MNMKGKRVRLTDPDGRKVEGVVVVGRTVNGIGNVLVRGENPAFIVLAQASEIEFIDETEVNG